MVGPKINTRVESQNAWDAEKRNPAGDQDGRGAWRGDGLLGRLPVPNVGVASSCQQEASRAAA